MGPDVQERATEAARECAPAASRRTGGAGGDARLVPRPRRSPETGGPGSTTLRAEVRAAALASGDVPRLAAGERHELGLALDEIALAEAPPGAFRSGIGLGEHGVGVRGTLVARAGGLYGLPVLEVMGVPVLLLGRRCVLPLGARVVASGFLSVERRLWAGSSAGCRPWRVGTVRREELAGLSPTGFVVTVTELERLPAAGDVDVRCQYVVDLRPC